MTYNPLVPGGDQSAIEVEKFNDHADVCRTQRIWAAS